MITSFAKNNLVSSFKARFSKNEDASGYVFYANEHERGFACTSEAYEKYVADFKKSLKWITRIFWVSLIPILLLIVILEIEQDYKLTKLEFIVFIAMPLPLLFIKGYKAYNAPNVLKCKSPITSTRSKKEITSARIKGISWTMITIICLGPLIGIYSIYGDKALPTWKLSLYLGLYVAVFCFGIYLIWKKREHGKE